MVPDIKDRFHLFNSNFHYSSYCSYRLLNRTYSCMFFILMIGVVKKSVVLCSSNSHRRHKFVQFMEKCPFQVDETDGWPDKICIQCVHQVSRCHAFKSRVEKSDQQLRQYIKGITVIVEEPITQIELPQQIHRNEIQLSRNDNAHHHVQVAQSFAIQPLHTALCITKM